MPASKGLFKGCGKLFFVVVSTSPTLLQNMPLFQAICPGSLWARDNRWLLSRVQRLAGPAGGTGAFCPGWRHQPGQKGGLLSRLVDPTGTKCPRTLLSRSETPIGTKGPPFVPVGVSNRDKRPLSPRLAVGPGTKATYCPGPKACRDKWPGIKAYSVVVGFTIYVMSYVFNPLFIWICNSCELSHRVPGMPLPIFTANSRF